MWNVLYKHTKIGEVIVGYVKKEACKGNSPQVWNILYTTHEGSNITCL